jgi:hypothetical protein
VGILLSHLEPSLCVVTDGDDDAMSRIVQNFEMNQFVKSPSSQTTSEKIHDHNNNNNNNQINTIENTSDVCFQPLWLKHSSDSSKQCYVAKFLWENEIQKGVVTDLAKRATDSDISAESSDSGKFDLIVAADVVYEVCIPTSFLVRINTSRAVLLRVTYPCVSYTGGSNCTLNQCRDKFAG